MKPPRERVFVVDRLPMWLFSVYESVRIKLFHNGDRRKLFLVFVLFLFLLCSPLFTFCRAGTFQVAPVALAAIICQGELSFSLTSGTDRQVYSPILPPYARSASSAFFLARSASIFRC